MSLQILQSPYIMTKTKKWIIAIAVILFLILIAKRVHAEIQSNRVVDAQIDAQNALQQRLDSMTVEDTIIYASKAYGGNLSQLKAVSWCESGNKYNVYGDGGDAYGIFQFHRPTFDQFSKEMGLELDYYSSLDQAKVASYMFANGKQSHWTCWHLTR